MAQGSWELAARIEHMITALENDGRVRLLASERGAPLTQDALERIHERLGWTLDERFLQFFRINDGLRIVWVDASFESPEPADAEPWKHFLATRDADALGGSINVPSLETVLFDWSNFDSLSNMVGEHIARALGGWDMDMFYRRLKNIDDYESDLDMGSYFLPGMMLDPLYPHPVVFFSDDYTASVDSSYPMLAEDYLNMIVATLGIERARKERMSYIGDATRALFIPPDGWLRDFPDAEEVLDALFAPARHAASSSRLTRLLEVEGQPVLRSEYASYVDTTLHDSKRIPEDTPPVRILRKDQFRWEHGGDLWQESGRAIAARFPEDRPLVMPVLDPTHYRAENRMTASYMPTSTLRSLIGSPIKLRVDRSWQTEDVACLIGVDEARRLLWCYKASFSDGADGTLYFNSYSYNATSLDDIEWIGLAIPDLHHDW